MKKSPAWRWRTRPRGGVHEGRREDGRSSARADAAPPSRAQPNGADLQYTAEPDPTPQQIEQGLFATDWTEVVQARHHRRRRAHPQPGEVGADHADRVNNAPCSSPLRRRRPARRCCGCRCCWTGAFFSPGEMDGYYGKNTAKAVYFFQQANGMRGTARVDSATFAALARAGGSPQNLIRPYRLTADDVKGPIITIPENVQAQAQLPCSCYNSLTEKLGEMFHIAPDLLRSSTRGWTWTRCRRDRRQRPLVRDSTARGRGRGGPDRGVRPRQLRAGAGRVGRGALPLPQHAGRHLRPVAHGEFTVTPCAGPAWHYQPEPIATAPDTAHEAMVPAGPTTAWARCGWRCRRRTTASTAPTSRRPSATRPRRVRAADQLGREVPVAPDPPGAPVSFADIQGRAGGQSFGDQGMRAAARDVAAPGAARGRTAPPRPRPRSRRRARTAPRAGARAPATPRSRGRPATPRVRNASRGDTETRREPSWLPPRLCVSA